MIFLTQSHFQPMTNIATNEYSALQMNRTAIDACSQKVELGESVCNARGLTNKH